MATEIWKSQSAFIRKSQLVSEKSTQRFAQLCPTPWALMPKVVGYSYPSYRSRVPMFKVIRAHVRGHYFSMWFNDFSCPLLVLFVRRVDSVKTYL